MDTLAEITPLPPLEKTKEETLPPEGIVLSPELSNAIGESLHQGFAEDLNVIQSLIENLDQTHVNKFESERIKSLKLGFENLNEIIKKLKESKETKIVPKSGQELGPILAFSDKTKPRKPKEGEIRAGKATPWIIRVLNHEINTPVTLISGNAELLTTRSNDLKLQEYAKTILNLSQSITSKLKPFQKSEQNPVEDISIITDSVGNTTFKPILTPPQSNNVT